MSCFLSCIMYINCMTINNKFEKLTTKSARRQLVSMRMDPDVYAQLDAMARRDNRSKSNMIEKLIKSQIMRDMADTRMAVDDLLK
jgi:predicted DNA-binding protein